jgi:hypothetical protein
VNPEKEEWPPLETAAKQRLVMTLRDNNPIVICGLCNAVRA